jgi:hypothetical protein
VGVDRGQDQPDDRVGSLHELDLSPLQDRHQLGQAAGQPIPVPHRIASMLA